MSQEAKARCRVCGCTDEDCSGCIARTGQRCSWVTPNLCSACLKPAPEGGQGLKYFEDEVVSQVDGSTETCRVFACAECGGLHFGLFQIAGQDHEHLQCVECGTSYCSGGKCAT